MRHALPLMLLLSACAVGPSWRPPATPSASGYTREPLVATASAPTPAGVAQTIAPRRDIPADWWTVFRSPKVDALVKAALAANPTIPAAEAALRAAQENVRAQQGQFFPQVGAGIDLTRQRQAPVTASSVASNASLYSLHTAGVTAAFTPDIFGLNRRSVESLEASAGIARQQLAAAQLSVTSNVVLAAVQLATLKGQIEATQATLTVVDQQIAIFRKQLALGAIPEANLIAQEQLAAQFRSVLPGLQKQQEQTRDLIAALIGQTPDAVDRLDIDLADLTLPQDLPLALPSELAHRRPDILAAEAQLHAANAQVGVATANLFPQLTLTAGTGSSATAIGALLGPGTGFWNLAAGLLGPIFQGGTLRHRLHAAEALRDQAFQQYRATVLAGLQNVADTLYAIRFDADVLAAAATAERRADETLAIARRQVELGDAGYIVLLTAQQQFQQARLTSIAAQGARLSDSAALFEAIGGGWSNRAAAGPAGVADAVGTTAASIGNGGRGME